MVSKMAEEITVLLAYYTLVDGVEGKEAEAERLRKAIVDRLIVEVCGPFLAGEGLEVKGPPIAMLKQNMGMVLTKEQLEMFKKKAEEI